MCESPDIIAGNDTQVEADMSATTTDQPKELYSSGYEHVPKARKTYTISKQRERWTDEEHNKFIEALKLNGRAWRHIEEHVGTKTAVQIRSHAQKFFSKVARVSSGNSTSSVKAIEIPPPRPKRKPLHPYPRKLQNPSIKGVPASQKSKRDISSVQSNSEAETQSPISVLSSNGSDAIGSSTSNALRHCQPVNSYTSNSSPNAFTLYQNENISFQSSSPEEENGYSLSGTTSVDEILDEKPRMESEDALVEAPVTSLRLFGKNMSTFKQNVSTSNLSRMSPVVVKELDSSQSTFGERLDVDMEKYVQSTSLRQEEHVTKAEAQHDSAVLPCQFSLNAWSCGASHPFYCFPSEEGLMNTTHSTITSPTPWWQCYGGLPLPLMHLPNFGLYQHYSGFGRDTIVSNRSSHFSDEKESAGELQTKVDSTNSKLAPEKQRKGFVPYKR